jgi:FHA domain
MEIVHCLLEAINPVSRPQSIPINVLPNQDSVLGRANFFDGEDTIISRRHARFSILSGLSAGQQPDKLQVSNLSHVNGLLVNFEPLQPFQSCTLQNGDEIVPPIPFLFLYVWIHAVCFSLWQGHD